MSVPYNNDTRESYIALMKATYLDISERHHDLGNESSMWQHLFTWVQCEEIYGEHWDKLKEKNHG
jgi:hypothetical protein